MPTAKPRLQVTLRPHTYLLLGRLAKLRKTSKAAIVSEFVEEVAPVLQRVAAVMEKAAEAQNWKTQWRKDMEQMQDELEGSAQLGLEFLDAAVSGVGRRPTSKTPDVVTRGSEMRRPLKSLKTRKGLPK